MLNFAELYSAVQGLIERSDTNLLNKIKDGINAGYRFIWGKRPWYASLRQTTFTGVAGLDYFITNQDVEMVIDISQHQTPILLALQRYAALLSRNVDIITTKGYPSVASPSGEIGIKVALPSDSTITIVSSNNTDSIQTVRIRGYSTGLIPISEMLTLTGTTPVTGSLTFSSQEGYEPRFSKSATTSGIVTISSGSTTIAEIAPDSLEVRYKKWKVWPVFTSSLTMYLTFKKRTYQLINNDDVPELECDNALIQYGFAYVLREKRQLTKAQQIMGQVDANGFYPAGTFMAELDQLIANEPQFSENFNDQLMPVISKEAVDTPSGQTGFQLWPSTP